jgi:hypothetical protein
VGIAVSLILIAFGAILTWAVNSEPSGLDLDVVGVVLMLVGLVGLLITLLFWYDWGPGPGRSSWRRSRYVDEDVEYRRRAPRRREVVVEEDREVVGPGEPPPP